jgi:hypothetical protein
MSSRLSAVRLPAVNEPVLGRDLVAFMRLLRECPIFDGRMLELAFDGSTNAQLFRHGLGRTFRGLLYAGSYSSSIHFGWNDAQGVTDAGADPAVYVRIRPDNITATDGRALFWVF